MNAADYCIKFALFWFFFLLWSAPLVVIFVITPSTPGILYFIDAVSALAFMAWLLAVAPWLAHMAAHRSTYDFASPIASIRWAVDSARVHLSFLPIVGPSIAPRVPPGASDPIDPK